MNAHHIPGIPQYDPLLRPEEASECLGISKAELHWLRSQPGERGLRAVKFGRTVAYRTSDVLGRARTQRSDMGWATDLVRPSTVNLLKVEDAARYLTISAGTLYRWRSARPRNGPRAVKFGGSVRYKVAELNRWIESRIEDSRP